MRVSQFCRNTLIVCIVFLAFFLLKRPAYYGDAEAFMMDGGDLVKYVGIAIGVLLGLAGIMFLAVKWMERGNPTPQYNNFGRRVV